MAVFRYEAVDKTGKVVHGAMNASNEQQVAQNLARMGYTLRSLHSTSPSRTQAAAAAAQASAPRAPRTTSVGGVASVTVASGVPVSIRSSVHPAVLARFFRQLATLVRSGMPLNQALHEMSGLTANARLRKLLPRMQEATQGGNKLSSLMAQYPGVFPVHTIASVWSGELAGKLEIALDEVASDLEQEASEVRYGRLGWGLTKLNWLGFIFLLPACSAVDLLIPVLSKVLKPGTQMGRQEILAEIGRVYFRDMFWRSVAISAAMVVLWIAWGHVKRVAAVKRLLDGALLHVPIWGALHRARALARFTHVLDSLYASGISPASAWDAASLTVRNSALAEKLRLARNACSPSAGLADMFLASGAFTADDVAFAATGEKTGQVSEVLADMSANYADRASVLKTAGRTASIFLMTVLGIALGFYAIYKFTVSYVDLAFKAAEMMGR